MAINIPIVTDFNSKGLQDASNAFTNFRTKVSEADGAMGKMKAGFGAAADTMKANAGAFAAAAGAAILGFVVDAIGDFQKLALEVDKFSNITGLAAEEASRFVEVAGDLGIEASTVSGALNKMNRAVIDNADAFSDLGIEIARTSGGATDVNRTFLNVIDRLRAIQDPAARASVATKLLGKSWTEVSELIEMGAVDLERALSAVGDAKIIDEKEIQKAKEFRAAQDALRDAFEQFAIVVAQEIVPVLSEMLDGVAKLLDETSTWGRITKGVSALIRRDMDDLADAIMGPGGVTEAVDDGTRAWQDGYRAMIDAQYALQGIDAATRDVDAAYAALLGRLDEREAWYNLVDDIDRAGEQAKEAFEKDMPNALGISMKSLDDARRSLGEYIAQANNIPAERKTAYIAALDTASWEQVRSMLDALAIARAVPYQPVLSPGFPGGPVEQGPGGRPIGTPPISQNPNLRQMSLMPTATGGNVIVNVGGSVTTENDLVEAIRKGLVNSQRNGSGLVYSNF